MKKMEEMDVKNEKPCPRVTSSLVRVRLKQLGGHRPVRYLDELGAVLGLQLFVEGVIALRVDQLEGALWRRPGRLCRHVHCPPGHLRQGLVTQPADRGRAGRRRWRQQADGRGN